MIDLQNKFVVLRRAARRDDRAGDGKKADGVEGESKTAREGETEGTTVGVEVLSVQVSSSMYYVVCSNRKQ